MKPKATSKDKPIRIKKTAKEVDVEYIDKDGDDCVITFARDVFVANDDHEDQYFFTHEDAAYESCDDNAQEDIIAVYKLVEIRHRKITTKTTTHTTVKKEKV